MDKQDRLLIDRAGKVLFQTYARFPTTFVRGEGCWLEDQLGNKYLDCLGGLAVTAVGHANRRVAKAVATQIERLTHVSNLYFTEPMVELAERLRELSGLERVFFANDGATANEAAIKLARRWGQRRRGSECYEVITLDNSFHGRTLATLAATGQPAKQATFAPLPPGFRQVAPEDIEAMEEAVSGHTAAVMIETIQAEGGVLPLSKAYMNQLRQLCTDRDVLLIVDDIQAGMGRTGEWYSWQRQGFTPDVVTMAKALANGLPIGVCLAREEVAETFSAGDHATTFGGGPVVCAAALAVLEEIEHRGLLANCRSRSDQLREGLSRLPGVKEVRGRGLLLAAVLEKENALEVTMLCHTENGLVVNAVRPDAIRLTPPLIISQQEAKEAITRFKKALVKANSSDEIG